MLDWHSWQIYYPLEIKILLLLLHVISNASALGERDELYIVEIDGTPKARL